MNNIQEKINQIQLIEGEHFKYDEAAIITAYDKKNETSSSLAIKILTIFGGLLATIAFMAFLFLAGIYNSDIALLISGLIFIISAIGINKKFDEIIMDTFSISLFVVGLLLFSFGVLGLKTDETVVTLLIIGIAFMTIAITQNYILAFTSILIINGSLLFLIGEHRVLNLIHLYILLNATALTYWMLGEAKIMHLDNKMTKLYYPIRIGLLFSLLVGLAFISRKGLMDIPTKYLWFSSVVHVPILLFLTKKIIEILTIEHKIQEIQIYIGVILLLGITFFAPALTGAIIILLLSFLVNYKTGIAIGIISIAYFISQYYYDLHYTLLVKSGILFFSGIVCLLFYFFMQQKMRPSEKV